MKFSTAVLTVLLVTAPSDATAATDESAEQAPPLRGSSSPNHHQPNLFGNAGKKKDVPIGQGNPNFVPFDMLPKQTLPSVDRAKVTAEDAKREAQGGPMRFAVGNALDVNPDNGDGTWDISDDGTQVWRYRVKTTGCNSLNFGFCEFEMPIGGKLYIYDAKERASISRPFTFNDNSKARQLWTPILESCDAIIEVDLPVKASPEDLKLSLCSVNVGYRGFSTRPEQHGGNRPHRELGLDDSGSCNNNAICSVGDSWRSEVSTVAAMSFNSPGGSFFCTGSMINNVRRDYDPLFLTAYHCGVRADNAPSLVAYWNYESVDCSSSSGMSKAQFTTGSTLLADSYATDYTLVRLNSIPDIDWDVHFAGWDKRNVDASSAVAVHHPRGDVKKISFENNPTTTTAWKSNSVTSSGTHVRVADWDDGTTEPSSSGSPLFNQDHRIIGQLHGGYAACGNNLPDWYGKLAVSWNTGLSNYLDPDNSGVEFMDTLSPTVPPTPCSGKRLAINVLTDRFPEEIRWELINTFTGQVVESSSQGSYTSTSTNVSDEYCVPEAIYKFVISDSANDGICCGYGSGSYSVTYDGSEVASGGEFGSSETTAFGSEVISFHGGTTYSKQGNRRTCAWDRCPSANFNWYLGASCSCVNGLNSCYSDGDPTTVVSFNQAKLVPVNLAPNKYQLLAVDEDTTNLHLQLGEGKDTASGGNCFDDPLRGGFAIDLEGTGLSFAEGTNVQLNGWSARMRIKVDGQVIYSGGAHATGTDINQLIPAGGRKLEVNCGGWSGGCTSSIYVAPECEKDVAINVLTDRYPEETSWTLTNTCTGEVAESAPQGRYGAKATSFTDEYCLPEAAYRFVISDAFGDGICCDYGSGSYSVTYDGSEVASGGAFGASQAATFGGTCP